jgi:hypothetical protein
MWASLHVRTLDQKGLMATRMHIGTFLTQISGEITFFPEKNTHFW